MDYHALLDLSVALGYELQISGAETYRVEESISRLLSAYGVKGEAFSIPNCIIVSPTPPEGDPPTRMCRVTHHGTDLDRIERFSGLSRRLCAETPSIEDAFALLKETKARGRKYRLPLYLLACFFAAAGFSMFFKGTPLDALTGGLCGAASGLCLYAMDYLHANEFFKTILCAFVAAACGHLLSAIGMTNSLNSAIIGALTILIPGFLFTNSMRDIIYGDTMSGVNRLVQVLIITVAIALGSGGAMAIAQRLGGSFPSAAADYGALFQCLIVFAACLGYCVLFNIHGPGMLLCALGSALGWAAFLLFSHLGLGGSAASFIAAVVISAYAEIMARVRKYPATSYLVISLFPLFPGSYLYYALEHAMRGQTDLFAEKALYGAGIAGSLAVGVFLVSTCTRLWTVWKRKREK